MSVKLDEISKDLAMRYMLRAGSSAEDGKNGKGDLKAKLRNHPGYAGNHYRGTAGTPEEKHAAQQIQKKIYKRSKGINQAYKRIYNEEEELDELSTYTMRNYMRKSIDQIRKKKGDRDFKPKATKRDRMINIAARKVSDRSGERVYAQEEVVSELSMDSAAGYFNRAAADRGKAEKEGDTKRLKKRDVGLERAYARIVRNSPKHRDPNFKKK